MTTRIVLIEDDPGTIALVEEILRDLGHHIDVRARLEGGPSDGEAQLVITGLIALRSFEPAAARDWIARVRSMFPNAAILVATVHGSAARGGAEALGADALLIKPFDIAVFTETVQSLLGA